MNKIIFVGIVLIGIFILSIGQYNAYSSSASKTEFQVTVAYENHLSESCHCVAFRFDDISDYKNEVKIEVINTFYKKHAPLTLGIVGDRFGENEKLLNYIKGKIHDESFDLEIANHGWEHEDFSTLDKVQQTQLIKKTNDKVYDILGIRPTVFIPPHNRINDGTRLSLQENGMTHFSAYLRLDSNNKYPLSNSDLFEFPVHATTGDKDPETNLVYGHPHQKTFAGMKKSFNKHGFAVVVLHPSEFAVIKDGEYLNEANMKQILELELLIDMVRENGLEIVPIGKINAKVGPHEPIIEEKSKNAMRGWVEGERTNSDFTDTLRYLRENFVFSYYINPQNEMKNQENIPMWLKNNVSWWLEKKISTGELVNGINFLMKKEILII